ncbi:prepilin peptidase [Nocardioides alcanivorans]|uniref:prepilin peptidase n=1 Tax=Nocardioides alcanivorans TaxID=2897352 RepID=UPI001F2AFF3F|nr:prepilin peptidase [Nocardioides alcanivorans]
MGAALGASIGWDWALLVLLPLAALGVALAHIDFRTRLLPKKLVLPAYPALLVALVVVALLDGSADGLIRAAWGWLIASALYWCLWKFTRGMGYGDVRMSGLLGLALGSLGWSTLLLGLYAGFVVGVVGWVALRLLRLTKDRHFPFGPFMLIGAVVGIVLVAAGWSPIASG